MFNVNKLQNVLFRVCPYARGALYALLAIVVSVLRSFYLDIVLFDAPIVALFNMLNGF